jgi:hypothetical protein
MKLLAVGLNAPGRVGHDAHPQHAGVQHLFSTRSSIVVRCRSRSGGNLVAQSEREQRQHANVGGGEPPELCGAPVRQLHGAWHERARVVHCRGGESRLDAQKASIAAAPELGRSWLVEWRFRVRAVVAGQPAGGRSVLLNNSVRALGWAGVRQPGRRGAGPRLPARRPAAGAAGQAARPAAGAPLPLSRGRAARLPGWQPSARSPEPRCPAPGSRAARPVGTRHTCTTAKRDKTR